jgi:hypothetical protein
MIERHSYRLPLLAIVAVAVALFALPLVRGEVLTFRDHSDYFVPLRFYTATHLRVFRLPLWNPYSASGEPWMANPQTAVFYPPAWMFIVLPFRTAYVAFLAFHLALLGAGAYLLFARNASRGAALFGAITLMLCGPVLSMLDVGDNLASFAWLPWVMWSAFGGRRNVATSVLGGPLRTGVILALCFLAGEPFVAAFAALLYAVIVRRPREISKTALLTIALSAIQLLPFLELLRGSDRQGGFAGRDILRDSMPVLEWWRVAVPARADAAGYDAALSQHFIPIVYIGAITAMLAVVGVVTAIRARSVAAAGWLALLAISIGIAAGPSLLSRLPVTILRYPARMVPFGALAIVALAVEGWERLRRRREWLDALIIIAVAGDLIAASIPLLRSGPMPQVPYARSFGADAKIVRIDEVAALRRGASREAWIAGYLNLLDRRFDAWTAAPLTSRAYADLYARALNARPVLRRLGIGYVLSPTALVGEGIVPLVRTDGVYATALSDSLPLARVQLSDGTVVPVRSVALDSSRARVTIDIPSEGLLVLTQRTAPGWHVRVDGLARREEIVDGLFRAVRVSRGKHEVEWTFAPLSLWLGAIATIAAMIFIFFRARLR